MIYIVIFILLIWAELAFLNLAAHYKIIDNPNERSSHKYVVIRGGGIIFPIAIFLYILFFNHHEPWAISGLIFIALISFIDDLFNIHGFIRFFVHLIAATLLFIQFSFFHYPWYYWLPAYIVIVGWINSFNFMDGINGITSFYSLVCLGTFLFLSKNFSFVSVDLLIILIISVLVFSYFNARKFARTFAGDVGSISMAFILGWIIFSLILNTQRIEYILFYSVYAIDTFFTIMYRLIRCENIFRPHRNHLYQYLSNEMKLPHVFVSVLYSAIQLIINITAILLIEMESMTIPVFVAFCIILSAIYLFARYYVLNKFRFL